MQRIAPYQPSKLEVFDLSQAVDPEIEARHLVEHGSFSLEHGPLARFLCSVGAARSLAGHETSPHRI